MILYHGSNVAVEKPALVYAKKKKIDFGAGFYLTSSREQAEKWAMNVTKRRGTGSPTLSLFEFDSESKSELNVKVFAEADSEWLNFVAANRMEDDFVNNYELIIGPVANDQTMNTLMLFLEGEIDEEFTLRKLLTFKLKDQYVFRTQNALNKLHFKEVIAL